MLKEIICDKIADKRIIFNNGLNVVVGDDNAANSIGKSTALMLIDFAFGGDSYADRDDVLTQIGAHEVCFHFVFEGQDYYFKRNTSNRNSVQKCDEDYNDEEQMSNNEYKAFLTTQYHIPILHLSFREMVGQFSRIYHIGNCDENNPLNPGYNHNMESRVTYLIKLLNKYQKVAEQAKIKEDAEEKLSAYNKAIKLKLVPVINGKREYKENDKEIDRLNGEIDLLKLQIANNTIDLTSEQLARISVIKAKLARIQKDISLTQSLINGLQQNISDSDSALIIDIERLKELFPSAEVRKMQEVNDFHANLTSILHNEITDRIKNEQKKLAWLRGQEKECVERITQVATETNPDTLALDRLVSTKQSVDQLISGKESFDTKQILTQEKKYATELYNKIVSKVLTDIEFRLNKEMERLNKLITGEDKKTPKISLDPKSYSIFCENDTGTGTGFRALLTFDLAILSLTALPFLIHDSLLFKNVEDDAIKGIIDLYSKGEKQVFISLDKLPSYQKEVQDAVESHKVLKLSSEHTLYGIVWNR